METRFRTEEEIKQKVLDLGNRLDTTIATIEPGKVIDQKQAHLILYDTAKIIGMLLAFKWFTKGSDEL